MHGGGGARSWENLLCGEFPPIPSLLRQKAALELHQTWEYRSLLTRLSQGENARSWTRSHSQAGSLEELGFLKGSIHTGTSASDLETSDSP